MAHWKDRGKQISMSSTPAWSLEQLWVKEKPCLGKKVSRGLSMVAIALILVLKGDRKVCVSSRIAKDMQ